MKMQFPNLAGYSFVRQALSLALSASMFAADLPPKQPAPAVQILLDKARAQEGRGRLDLAGQTWRHVLLADRNNAEALAGLAREAKQSGRAAESKQYLDKLRNVNPKSESIAKIEGMQALRASANKLAQAGTLASQQRLQEAMEIYREAFGDEPPPGNVAIAYYETLASTATGWEAATAGLARFASRYPQATEYQFSLARLYTYRPKSRSEGIRMLLAVPAESPFAAKARLAVRQALLWEGPSATNVASLKAYLSRNADSELEGLLAKASKNADSVVAPSKTSASLASVQAGGFEQAGYEALKAGRFANAADQFEMALQSNPGSVTALAGLGHTRMSESKFRDAEEAFEKALAISPDNKEVTEALRGARFWSAMSDGARAMQAKRYTSGEASYRKALGMRPTAASALQGLGGALMAQGKFDDALVSLTKVTEMEPDNGEAWRECIRAQFQARGAEAALALLDGVTPKAAMHLADDVDHQALLASIYGSAGRSAEAVRTTDRAIQTATKSRKQLTQTARLQFAGVYLSHNEAAKAAELYNQVVDRESSNLVAWEGLVAALVSLHDDKRAATALDRMPRDLYRQAMERPGFASAASIVESNNGRLEQAEALLTQTLASQGAKPELGTQLQLASIWVKQNRIEKAEPLVLSLTKEHPMEPEVWKVLMQMLEKDQRTGQALLMAQRIPAEVKARLYNDADFVALMASVHSAEGDDEEALRLVRAAVKRLGQQQRNASPRLLLQHGWLALRGGGDDREIYGALSGLQQTGALDEQLQKNSDTLWSVWTRKRADAAREAGDLNRAVALLETARKALPEDRELRSSLAGMLVAAGMHDRAIAIYKTWGLKDATPAEYRAAIGAAMAQDKPAAEKWMNEALSRWPSDPEVLDLAGKFASQQGDYKRAQAYWRSALSYMSRMPAANVAPDTYASRTSTGVGVAGGRSAARMGMAFAGSTTVVGGVSLNEVSALRALDPENEGRLGAAPVMLASSASAASSAIAPASNQGPAYSAQRMQLEREIAAVDSRNASFANFGTIMDSRSGRDGFDKRVIQESNLEISHVLANKVRVGLVATPTTIDAGTPSGNAELRFGVLPKGSNVGEQKASGIAAELQASTNTFGISAGATPQGFAVQNFVGGIRFRPGNGPIEVKLRREAVRDTMLSFAGATDPVTGQTWGGVVATGGKVQWNWGDENRGWYAGAAYDLITGKNVAKNRRVDATAGYYKKVYGNADTSVTVGINAFTMRYDKNLRYFTLGQGGYFSPQSYYLVNVPFAWTGRYQKRLLYSVSGAIGMQKFREDASPYFPTLASLQGKNGPYYASTSNTGVNYGLQASLLYQLTEHLYAGGFLSVNNTRNYNTQAAGLSVKYLFQARPLVSDQQLLSVPQWTGQQPFQPR